MRTIEFEIIIPGSSNIAPINSLSTEVIIEDDSKAMEAGYEAAKALYQCIEGVMMYEHPEGKSDDDEDS